MGKYLIIPEREKMTESLKLAEEYNLGFEINDFFAPALLHDKESREQLINEYAKYNLPGCLTMHGSFHDVLIFSEDKDIRNISEKRVEDSICTAKRLGALAVVFHSNLNPALTLESYRTNWVDCNARFFGEMCRKYPDINIYLENMFDDSPYELAKVCERLRDVSNFGITFDYAHASIYGTDITEWVKVLQPYIKHVHINDNDGKNDLHLAVGDGTLDWDYFDRLQKTYLQEVTVLIENSNLKQQRKSLEFLSKKGILS